MPQNTRECVSDLQLCPAEPPQVPYCSTAVGAVWIPRLAPSSTLTVLAVLWHWVTL